MTEHTTFLCHSSEDKDSVRLIASGLMEAGINVWFDEWEIRTGDSIRRKIEEGLLTAGYFIPILTPNSLASEWVQTELDAALALRIEGTCKILPVLLGINTEDISPILRGTHCIVHSNPREVLDKLVSDIHNYPLKPELGVPPTQETIPHTQLTNLAVKLGKYIAGVSETGKHRFEFFDYEQAREILGYSNEEMEEAADEMQENNLLELHNRHTGSPCIGVCDELFWRFDRVVCSWDTDDDAVHLCGFLANKGEGPLSLSEVASELGWDARRINPAASLLEANDICNFHKAMGTYPFAYSWVQATPRTRRFAKERR